MNSRTEDDPDAGLDTVNGNWTRVGNDDDDGRTSPPHPRGGNAHLA